MTAIYSTKSLATAAANGAGFLQGEYTVTKAEGGWTFEVKETAPTLALAAPVADQDTAEAAQQGGAPEAAGTGTDAPQQPDDAPAGTAAPTPTVTFPATVFPTVEHAIAWAKVDGFAKNRIVVEPVLGGFLFRPLAEGEKYVALGSAPRTSNGPAFPAPGTKKRILIDMVCRPEGASMEELETAVGWKKCSGTLNELDEAFGLEIEYRKKGKVGRYYGTFPAAFAPASAEPASEPQQDEAAPLAA